MRRGKNTKKQKKLIKETIGITGNHKFTVLQQSLEMQQTKKLREKANITALNVKKKKKKTVEENEGQ